MILFPIIWWNGYVNGTLSLGITTLKYRHTIKAIALGKTLTSLVKNFFFPNHYQSLSLFFVISSIDCASRMHTTYCSRRIMFRKSPQHAYEMNWKLEQIEIDSLNFCFSISFVAVSKWKCNNEWKENNVLLQNEITTFPISHHHGIEKEK